MSFGVPAQKNLYLSLPFVQIRVPRLSLCGIHPVSALIPSVLRELVATVVCLPLPPHQNCPRCEVRSLSQCVVLSDLSSTLKSQFCCRHLQRLTLCSLLVFNVFGYCPLFLREITDVLVSVSVDQESPLTSLWLHRRLHRRVRIFATVLEKLPLDVFSSLTDRYHPASTSLFLTLDFWLVL